jgi:hypothetical protein
MLRVMRLANALRLTRLLLAKGRLVPFIEVFRGFEKNLAVKEIFGDKTEAVLGNLKIELMWMNGYMWVNNENGHLMVSTRYLNEGDKTDIHLDVVHELVHVKQWMEGKELFDERYSYVERPTEIEAYQHTVKEARRMEMSDNEIMCYLKTEWITTEDLKQLAIKLDVKSEGSEKR